MKLLALMMFLVCAAWAQTKPDIRQTKAPSTPPLAVVVYDGGRPFLAVLGPGVTLDKTVSPPVLRVESPAAPVPAELRLSRQGSGWPLGRTCSKVSVFRNGVRQLAGEDFAIISNVIVFRSGAGDSTDPSEAGDVIVAECWQ